MQAQKSKNTQYKTKSDLNTWKKFCESPKESRAIECVRTCDQESYLFIETKESICIKKEFKSHRINLLLQYGLLFIVHSSNMADMTSCEHTLLKTYLPMS